MTRPLSVVAAAVLCAVLVLPGCRRASEPATAEPQEMIVPVGAAPAETAAIRAVVQAVGVVSPSEGGEFLVVAPEPARIAEIAKNEGDPVSSGDVLVRFELTGAAQEVSRLAAELTSAQALLENARINQARQRDFVERGLVPRRDLERAERELADAQAAADRALTASQAAERSAARAVVRSPFDGVVAGRRHNPGDVVLSSSSDPVLRVVDPRRLEIVASVAEEDASRVVPGATARITAPLDAAALRLTVAQRLVERVGPDDQIAFRLVFDTPGSLPVDARVDIEIDAEERMDTVVVPLEALLREDGQAAVMVAAGSRAERRAVTTGIEDEGRVEITSGLRAGELVITRGQIGLPDGAAISVAVGR